jgi:hypothetical protein
MEKKKLIATFFKNRAVFKNSVFFGGGGWEGQQPLVPLLLLGPPFFPIILFWSTTLTG